MDWFTEPLSHQFFRHGLEAGLLGGALCGLVGVYVVLKRMSYIGHGLSHAIFGSEVFPSPVLAQIAQESGAKYEDTLRDDDLPGDTGQPEHSYVGLMLYDVRTIVTDLGGDASALDAVPTSNPYD